MDINIEAFHRAKIKTREKEYEGIILKRPQLAKKGYLVLKVDSGYNIGIKKQKIDSVEDLGPVKSKDEKKERKKPSRGDKPPVSIVSTGGTIASRVDYLTGGVDSAFDASELISAVPELDDLAFLNAQVACNKFSENMQPGDWKRIAETAYNEIKDHVLDEDNKGGIVVTHGTDTMAYTAAALSFMLSSPVPVVLTGAQRSSDRGSSDASMNLIHSTRVAAKADLSGAYVLMHSGMSDNSSAIHLGTRSRKLHSSRRDAFHSVNTGIVGKVGEKIELNYRPFSRNERELDLNTNLNENVALLKYHPGLDPQVIDSLSKWCDGMILEGTGLGHVSEGLVSNISDAVSSGVTVCMCTQTVYGRVNMNVYSTGRKLLDAGVIPLGDMLSEVSYVKLMWVLGNYGKKDKIEEMMLTGLAGELSDRSPLFY